MIFSNNQLGDKKQSGIVLLLTVVLLALAAVTFFVKSMSSQEIKMNSSFNDIAKLKQAKQALIAYAITHADGAGSGDAGEFGYLPCPDFSQTNDEGLQDPNCDGVTVNTFGFFPWKSLDLPLLTDSTGTCLMYAVSSTYKNTSTAMINEDALGMFQVVDASGNVTQGVNPEDRPVAIVFAPGKALNGKIRPNDVGTYCGEDFETPTINANDIMQAYLEGNGTTDNGVLSTSDYTIDQFIQRTSSSEDEATPYYNDRFMTITRDEIWPPIVGRSDFQEKMQDLTEALAICLANYANANIDIGADTPDNIVISDDTGRRLPWPAKFNLGGLPVSDDLSYTDDNDMAGVAGDGYAGRYPYIVNKSNADLGLALGDVLFDSGLCGATVALSNDNIVDLSDAGSEFGKLWYHWKDHFFYVLSDAYKPVTGGAINKCDGNTCVSVDGTDLADKRAGIVIYSGSRLDGVVNDFNDATEYIESPNANHFPVYDVPTPGDIVVNENGGNEYQSNNGNDIMFCITDEGTHTEITTTPDNIYNPNPLSVNACP